MHFKGSDWNAHHHHFDAAYDNVVLHVVWEDDTPVFTSDNKQIHIIVLREFVDKRVFQRYKELLKSNLWVPCTNQIKNVDRLEQIISRLVGHQHGNPIFV